MFINKENNLYFFCKKLTLKQTLKQENHCVMQNRGKTTVRYPNNAKLERLNKTALKSTRFQKHVNSRLPLFQCSLRPQHKQIFIVFYISVHNDMTLYRKDIHCTAVNAKTKCDTV